MSESHIEPELLVRQYVNTHVEHKDERKPTIGATYQSSSASVYGGVCWTKFERPLSEILWISLIEPTPRLAA